jgi:hypothetical protein
MLGRASDLEALVFLSGEVSLASKPEELLIARARRRMKLINIEEEFLTELFDGEDFLDLPLLILSNYNRG